ncbi:MAG: hypothetical protein VB064_05580 [Oscillospiraceae bacterium]|nr:hypothetical protein [Oscillospiraceae bacterium]
MDNNLIRVGIGFATGRKNFQRVLRSYIYNWKESGLVDNKNVSLNLFVAYDLNYMGTKRTDYTAISKDVADLIDSRHFIGIEEVEQAKRTLADEGAVDPQEASLVFQKGYASSRNIILYEAMRNKMDYLLFLDDDEYPMAVTKNPKTALWSGQHVLKTHLHEIQNADITYGYHCGYISPIPIMEFGDKLGEDDFRLFIQAISNDIINWDNIKKVLADGGVTYADSSVLTADKAIEVQEENHAKFISGSNLCINLTKPERVFPFYNPPGARGEDTFLSTLLSDRKVMRIPCYAFHDGFSSYNHLLSGVLPTTLKPIKPDSRQIERRFYNACIGWVRYKPLLMYITNQEEYEKKIFEMERNLDHTLPLICDYFNTSSFYNVRKELNKYEKNVETHYSEYIKTKEIWSVIIKSLL